MSRNKKRKLFTFGVCNKIVNNGIYGQKIGKVDKMQKEKKVKIRVTGQNKAKLPGHQLCLNHFPRIHTY